MGKWHLFVVGMCSGIGEVKMSGEKNFIPCNKTYSQWNYETVEHFTTHISHCLHWTHKNTVYKLISKRL
jgi:hypothetical protein